MDGQCATLICDVDINVNWWGVVVVIPTALAIALVARMWSGSFKSPFAGHRPATWFLLVFSYRRLALRSSAWEQSSS